MFLNKKNIFKYKAFGLVWQSLGLEFPELIPADLNTNFDIKIENNNSINWPNIPKGEFDTDFVSLYKNEFRLTVNEIAKFRTLNGNLLNWDKLTTNTSNQDLRTFLLSSPMASILIQRNVLLFHGNALSKDGEAIICLGHSGIGKSTIAFSLMKNGWSILSDDIVAVSNSGNIYPGIPRIKLWQDAVEAFDINPLKLKTVRNKMNKFILGRDKLNISKTECKLKAIYLLRQNKNVEEDLVNLSPRNVESEKFKFISLRNNTFRPRLIKGLMKEKSYFSQIDNLVKSKNFSILPLPRGIKKMDNWLASQKL